MKKEYKWLVMLVCVLMTGCSGKLGGPDYKAWVESEDHGLKVSQVMQGYVFTLQYEPDAYTVMKQARNFDLDKAALDAGLEDVKGFDHYQLRISKEDGGNVLESAYLPGDVQGGREAYFSFGAEQDLRLLAGGAAVPPAFYHFEGQMGVRPYVTLVFAFPEMQIGGDMVVEFADQKLTGKTIRFVINGERIKDVPLLKEGTFSSLRSVDLKEGNEPTLSSSRSVDLKEGKELLEVRAFVYKLITDEA